MSHITEDTVVMVDTSLEAMDQFSLIVRRVDMVISTRTIEELTLKLHWYYSVAIIYGKSHTGNIFATFTYLFECKQLNVLFYTNQRSKEILLVNSYILMSQVYFCSSFVIPNIMSIISVFPIKTTSLSRFRMQSSWTKDYFRLRYALKGATRFSTFNNCSCSDQASWW